MIALTSGWTFRSVWVSSKARFLSSSLGRMSTSFRSEYFPARPSLMCLIHSFWLAAVREAVTIANEPFPPRMRDVCSRRTSAMPCGVAWFTKKSRASPSASASQVTTLMPLPLAFRRTVEIASLFSTLTAMTSTPRVIQASTTSFCFAGSVSVGPSHRTFTPSSAAASWAPLWQLTK